MRRIIGPLAASAAIAIMLIGSATAASATNTVALESGTLVAKGVAVVVPVTVTCAPSPFTGFVNVQLSERSGKGIAQGYGSASVVCEGTPQTVDVLVRAQGTTPFKNGTALATASLMVCDFSGCHGVSDTGEIRISK